MTENNEIKIRSEFNKKYGRRIEDLEIIAASQGYLPSLEKPLIDWILDLVNKNKTE